VVSKVTGPISLYHVPMPMVTYGSTRTLQTGVLASCERQLKAGVQGCRGVRVVHTSAAPGACEGEGDDCRGSFGPFSRLCGMSQALARISPRSCNHVSADGSRVEGDGAQDL